MIIAPPSPPAAATATSGVFEPVAPSQRSEWLDALRGFALLGILVLNIQVFSGYVFRSLVAATPMPSAAYLLDPALDLLAHAVVQGKFYSLFSFLFGLGFALQLRRAPGTDAQALPVMRRRMAWLLLFGLAHALLLWFGDILTVYAVFGFALLWFRNLSQRALLRWALFFLASPMLAYLVFMAVGLGDPLAGDPSVPLAESPVGKAIHAMTGGSYFDVVQNQALFYPGGWMRRALHLALPRIFGMFLLGAWVARIGFPDARDAHAPRLRRWLLWGLVLGLPLNIGYAVLGGNEAMLPASPTGLLVVVLASFGMPLLCLAYVAAFALYWRTSRPRSLLVAAGRTGLSHYLGQSVVCVLLFYGIGLGLFGRVSYAVALLIAVAVFLFLSWLGRLWLSRYRQGPMEALWRRLSYGRRDVTASRMSVGRIAAPAE